MPYSISAVSPVTHAVTAASLGSPTVTSAGNSSSFATQLAGAVDGMQGLQSTSDKLAVAAVTGDLTDIHNATIAATRAQVTLELMSTVRNQGVQAFNEIMRMQA